MHLLNYEVKCNADPIIGIGSLWSRHLNVFGTCVHKEHFSAKGSSLMD